MIATVVTPLVFVVAPDGTCIPSNPQPLRICAPAPRLLLAAPAPTLLLESPAQRADRLRADRARASRRELDRFLADFDAELFMLHGRLEVALIPRIGRYSIRRPNGASLLIISKDHTGLTFHPQPAFDEARRFYRPRPWTRHYAAFPARDALFLLLEQRIARFNAQGGHYTN